METRANSFELSRFVATGIYCVIAILICTRPLSGAAFVLLIFCLLVCFPILLFRKTTERRLSLLKIVCWLASLAVIVVVQTHHRNVAREKAEKVLTVVESYRLKNGSYPNASNFGLAQLDSKSNAYYALQDGKPVLFYRDSWMLFSTYEYDFESKVWRYRSD